MYAGYGSPSPLTNNPFLPNTGHQTSSRFPDISSMNGNSGFTGGGGGGGGLNNGSSSMMGGGYPQQQQQQQQQGGMYQQQQPMQTGWGGSGQMGGGYTSPTGQGYSSPSPMNMGGGGGSGFQPQSAFGQQLASASPHLSGSSYNYLNGGGQQALGGGGGGYGNPAQQQQQQLLSQFDPYSAIGQGWDPVANANNNMQPSSGMQQSMSTGSTQSNGSSYSSSSSSSAGYGTGPRGDSHPKDYIRVHKQAIESWDGYAWKQLLGCFDAMKVAWDARKAELTGRARELIAQGNMGMAYGPYYAQQLQQEASRLQGLLKEAETNFDSIAASVYQMQEVFQNYRQSGDLASKRRVREATNAALQGLPGWPQPY